MSRSIVSFLASNNYIIVNKTLAKKLGLKAALILGELASEYQYWEREGKLEDGYFYSTVENVENATGIKTNVQLNVIKGLVDSGILLQKNKGVPCKRYFKIDFDALEEVLSED